MVTEPRANLTDPDVRVIIAGEVCRRLTSRWREENYFHYARTHFSLDALDSQAQRDASLAALRNPAPGQPVTITNQMINALDAPVEAAWAGLQAAQDAAAAIPARIGLGEIRRLRRRRTRRPDRHAGQRIMGRPPREVSENPRSQLAEPGRLVQDPLLLLFV
jgi:hypothetical protein